MVILNLTAIVYPCDFLTYCFDTYLQGKAYNNSSAYLKDLKLQRKSSDGDATLMGSRTLLSRTRHSCVLEHILLTAGKLLKVTCDFQSLASGLCRAYSIQAASRLSYFS